MFKTEIPYVNFRGEKVSEVLRFNLSESELLDLQQADNTFSPEYLNRISEQQDVSKMFDVIRKLIAVSYGVMSEDGKYFRKRPEDIYDFLHSAAYDAFIEKLMDMDNGGDKLMTEFIINVFPAKFATTVREHMAHASQPVLAPA